MHFRGLKQETPAVVKPDRCDIVMYCGIISSELLLQTCILTKLNLSFSSPQSSFCSQLITMPTPIIDIECHREYIKSLFQEDNIKKQEICDILLQKFGIHISLHTLESQLKQWGIAKNRLSEDTPELRLCLTVLFFDVGLEDKDILHVLQHKGYQIELRKLQTIRKDMGLF